MVKLWTLLRQQLSIPWSPLSVLLFLATIILTVVWLPGFLLRFTQKGG